MESVLVFARRHAAIVFGIATARRARRRASRVAHLVRREHPPPAAAAVARRSAISSCFFSDFGSLDHLYLVFESRRRHRRPQRSRGSRTSRRCGTRRRSSRSTRSSSSRARTGATSPTASCICWAPTARRRRWPASSRRGSIAELAHARDLLSMPSAQIKTLVQQDPLGLLTMLRDRMSREKGFVVVRSDAGRLRQPGRPQPARRRQAERTAVRHRFLQGALPRGWPRSKPRPAGRGRRRRRRRVGRDPGGRRVSRVARSRAADPAREHHELDRLAGPAAARRVRRLPHAVDHGVRLRAARARGGADARHQRARFKAACRRRRADRPACCSDSASTASCCCTFAISKSAGRARRRTRRSGGWAAPRRASCSRRSRRPRRSSRCCSSIFRRSRISGSLVGLGILLCCGLTLLLLPALLPRRAGRPSRARAHSRMARPVRHAPRPADRLGQPRSPRSRSPPRRRGCSSTRASSKLQAQTRGALLEKEVAERFSLPRDVLLVLNDQRRHRAAARDRRAPRTRARGQRAIRRRRAASASCCRRPGNRRASREVIRAGGTTSGDAQRDIQAAGGARGIPAGHVRAVSRARPALLESGRAHLVRRTHRARPRVDRLPIRRPPRRALSLGDVSVSAAAGRHRRAFAGSFIDVDPGLRLTGLPVINHELRRQFFPQFLKGIALGTDRGRRPHLRRVPHRPAHAAGAAADGDRIRLERRRCSRCCASSSICSRSSRR